jgi:hypothetical protein
LSDAGFQKSTEARYGTGECIQNNIALGALSNTEPRSQPSPAGTPFVQSALQQAVAALLTTSVSLGSVSLGSVSLGSVSLGSVVFVLDGPAQRAIFSAELSTSGYKKGRVALWLAPCCLLTQPQTLDQLLVALGIFAFQVREMASALANQLEQSPARAFIMFVFVEMFDQRIDAGRQQRNLNFG